MLKYVCRIIIIIIIVLISYSNVNFAYQNPIEVPDEWPDYGIGDPFVMKYNGEYYLYASTGFDEYNEPALGVRCWSSRDLVNWQYEGNIILADPTPGTDMAASKGAFAPEVVCWNGQFYMYLAVKGKHNVFKSTSPTGPFMVDAYNVDSSIDGSVFIDDDGKWYFMHSGDSSGINIHEMSDYKTIVNNNVKETYGATIGGWTEGPFMIKRNGIYYLTYTGEHINSAGYRIGYAYNSTGPRSTYTISDNNPIIVNTAGYHRNLGHSSTVMGPDLDTYFIVYHNLHSLAPQHRKLNIDRIAWNGDKMLVLGPTLSASQTNPEMPEFFDRFERTSIGADWINVGGGNWTITDNFLRQSTKNTVDWYKEITTVQSASNYTAEFNLKQVSQGTAIQNPRFGVVFSYVDENNYGVAFLSKNNNRLETQFKVGGVDQGWEYATLPVGYDYSALHNIRVEKDGTTFKIFVDNMLKQTLTISGLGAGKIGYVTEDTEADFGFTAFSNRVNGSGIFDFYKPIPGTIQAVHYNTGGEGVGYHDYNPNNVGGQYRTDGVDIRECPEGGYNIGWNSTGDWLKYNVNIAEAGYYNVGIRFSSYQKGNPVMRLFVDDETTPSAEAILYDTGGWDNWQTYTLKNVNLPQGNHTLKVEITQGEFDLYYLKFVKADNNNFTLSDSYERGLKSIWNFIDGPFTTLNNECRIEGPGKLLLGDTGWSDYTVEVDVKSLNSPDAGILFRVTNPAIGWNKTIGEPVDPQVMGTDYLQGYYVKLTSTGVVLAKQNYNYTQLVQGPSETYTYDKWYHMKVEVSGNNFKVYVDGNLKMDYNDTDPFINGKVGLKVSAIDNNPTHFDNFTVYYNDGFTPTPPPTIPPESLSDTFSDGNDDGWTHYVGDWSVINGEYDVTYNKIAKSITGNLGWMNYSVEADIRVQEVYPYIFSHSAGILFRGSNPANTPSGFDGYYALINYYTNAIELTKVNTGEVLASVPFIPSLNTTYHMKVVAKQYNLEVYVDNMDVPIISTTDYTFKEGLVGLHSVFANARFDNFSVQPINLTDSPIPVPKPAPTSVPIFTDYYSEWNELGDDWVYENGKYKIVSSTGKTINGDSEWKDYIIETDMTTSNVLSGKYGLIVRVSDASATELNSMKGYFIGFNADNNTAQLYKIDNPTRTIKKTTSFQLSPNTIYHLKVVVRGKTIKLFVDDNKIPIIDKFDDDDTYFEKGQIGFWAENATVCFDTIIVKKLNYEILLEDYFYGDYGERWTTYGGTWSLTGEGLHVSNNASGKAIVNNFQEADYTAEVDITPIGNANTGIVFRVTNPGPGVDQMNGYIAFLDGNANRVVLGYMDGDSYQTIQYKSFTVTSGERYHMKVVVAGSNIKVYVNDIETPKIDVINTLYSEGTAGVRSHFIEAYFDNFVLKQNDTRPLFSDNFYNWTTYGGVWSEANGVYSITNAETGKSIVGNPDWIDYTVEVDVRPMGTSNTGIVFRVTNPGTGGAEMNGYFTWLNGETNRVALGYYENNTFHFLVSTDLGFAVVTGQQYHMKAIIKGNNFKVFVDDMTEPMIDYNDSRYKNGTVGLRSHFVHAEFDNFDVKVNTGDEFSDNFDFGEWTNYGGVWSEENFEYSANNTGVTGKSLNGSTEWTNYTVEADVIPLEKPNSGIIFRVTNPGDGADEMNGYFAGLDGKNSKIILGKMNGTYQSLITPVDFDVVTGKKYRMKVVVNGGNIKVYVDDMYTPLIDITDQTPFTQGMAGVRSHQKHVHFDNFVVKP